MATESVATAVTSPANFHYIHALGEHVFSVRGGIDADTVAGVAECIDEAVYELIDDGIANEGSMTVSKLWLLRFALQTAHAIREAAA